MIARWGVLPFMVCLIACIPSTAAMRPAQHNRVLHEAPSREFLASAHDEAVEVDLEMSTPDRVADLRQRGVNVPRASERSADPRRHRDFVERRVTAVGLGLQAAGYVLYCDGLSLPVLVPESHVDFGLTAAEPVSAAIYSDRNAALADLTIPPVPGRPARYAYYRGAGGKLIVPTVFSPATTPRIIQTMVEVRTALGKEIQRELKVLLLTLTGAKILNGVLARVVRLSAAAGPQAPARTERLGTQPFRSRPSPQPAGALEPQPSPEASVSGARSARDVNLVSPARRRHILEGDATGGGHRPGLGKPGKSEFPQGWSDDRIMHEISDVATDPASIRSSGRGGRTVVEGTRDGVRIKVILEKDGSLVTGFPTNTPVNP